MRLIASLHQLGLGTALLGVQALAWGHGVAEGDKGFVEQASGLNPIAFIYLALLAAPARCLGAPCGRRLFHDLPDHPHAGAPAALP